MNQVDDLLKTLNDFSFMVEATPLVLRQQQQKSGANTKLDLDVGMQPRLLRDQTNHSFSSHDSTKKDEDNLKASHTESSESKEKACKETTDKLPSALNLTSQLDWVERMRYAVHEWMKQQRGVIECERTQVTEQLQSYQHALVRLQAKYDALQQKYEDDMHQADRLQNHLRQHITHQQLHIDDLEKSLGVRKPVKDKSLNELHDPELLTPHPEQAPFFSSTGLSSFTPAEVMRPKSKGRIRALNERGNSVIRYANGAEKEILPDGSTVIRFANGDVQTYNAHDKTSTYYFAESKVAKTTDPKDGSIIYEFDNGQIERHFQDGRKLVESPDGRTRFWVGNEDSLAQTDAVAEHVSHCTESSPLRIFENVDKYAVRK